MVVATMFANVTAKAETVSTIELDSNKAKSTNDLNKLLVNGQEKELENFISIQSPALATKKEIVLVNKVLNLYNNNTAAFFALTDAQKQEFNASILIYVKNLNELKTIEATNWLNKVKHTANTVNLLCSVNQIEVLDSNNSENPDAVVTAI